MIRGGVFVLPRRARVSPTACQCRPYKSNSLPGLNSAEAVRLASWIRPFGYFSDTSTSMPSLYVGKRSAELERSQTLNGQAPAQPRHHCPKDVGQPRIEGFTARVELSIQAPGGRLRRRAIAA